MDDLTCDVLVVGAGPAGSMAARVAAENGARVALVERKAQVGIPAQCAGYVAKAIRWHANLSADCIAQPVDALRTHLPDGTVQETRVPGYILNRAALDRQLAREAITAGGRLLLKTTAIDRHEEGVLARREGQRILIRAKVVIGADGPCSLVARWLGLERQSLARAVQYEVVLKRHHAAAEVYFRRVFRAGYAWLFPAGPTARLGAAFVGDSRAGLAGLKQLRQELAEDGVIFDSALAFTAGFVPVGGPVALRQGNVLLVGDAAGQTHAITGAGILNAIVAGEMAGRSAALAALSGDLGLLAEYEEEWSHVFGPPLRVALEKRFRLEAGWDSASLDLSQLIRESWIAFDEYYAR